MDLYPGKKPVTSGIITRKRSGFASKDVSDNRNQEVEFCNRIGCNGRLKHTKNTLFGLTGKAKFSRPSSSSFTSKESIGCSSTTSKSVSGGVSKQVPRRERSIRLGTDSPQSSLMNQARFQTKHNGVSSVNDGSSEFERSNSKSTSVLDLNSASGSLNAMSASSSLSASTASSTIRKNNKGIRSSLRNPQSKSISENTPGVGIKSETNVSRKRVFKDRNPEGESSSSVSIERNVSPASNDVIKSSSRITRNPSSNTDARSTTTTTRSLRSSTSSQTRTMSSSTRDMSTSVSSISQPTRVNPQSSQSDSPIEARVNRPTIESSVSGHQNISARNVANILSLEHGAPHDAQRHTLNGIAEILMSLERIGQGTELTYEQLMSFESNLFLGGYQWFDRHRDMRLDIDNMSYEELLALEERMGNVSTALSEEALSKCINRSIYRNPSVQMGFSISCSESVDDVKCSVCQEEYKVGEEIGRLACEHRYHAECIEQWLGLKNWCPVCKKAAGGVAAPSTSRFKVD